VSITANVEGLSALLSKFKDLGESGTRTAKAVLDVTADQIVTEAKQSAPAAFGTIRQNIGKETVGELQVSVFSAAPESAYQEFGTGGKVQVPSEMSDIASTFQGKGGGDMQAFIQSLIDWIKLRGLTNTYSVKTHRVSKKGTSDDNTQLAWAIAKKILRDGLKPQPFLYPAYVNGTSKLLPLLQKAFDELLKSKQA
jgi:HK97 gp10 family phage protein